MLILATYSPETLWEWLGSAALFSTMAMVFIIIFILALDKIALPKFNLSKALEDKNLAAAIFLGACVIAAAIVIGKAIAMA